MSFIITVKFFVRIGDQCNTAEQGQPADHENKQPLAATADLKVPYDSEDARYRYQGVIIKLE
jgi:hypothetical protein